MARVPYMSRTDLPAPQQGFHDRIARPRGGQVPRVFSLLLNSPEFAARIADVGEQARFHTQVPADAREVAVLATARELDCAYEITYHTPVAKKAGVPDHVIEAITGLGHAGLPLREALIVEYTRQVVRHRVDDATFHSVEQHLGRQGAVELTAIIAYYAMLAHIMEALGIEGQDAP